MNSLQCLLVLLSLIIAQISKAATGEAATSLTHPVFLEHGHEISRRDAGQQIRITPHYNHEPNSFVTAEQREFLQNIIMYNVTEYFSRLLSVKPLGQQVPIRVARGCNGTATTVKFDSSQTLAPGCFGTCTATTTCGSAIVPEEHLFRCVECNSSTNRCGYSENSVEGTGVLNSDYVLYVTAVNTADCANNFAFASPCTLEYGLNRPVAGHVNFCPKAFEGATEEFLIAVVRHELIHALGFISFLYPFYHDDAGTPRTQRLDEFGTVPTTASGVGIPSNTTVRSVNYKWETANGVIQKEVKLIVTPRVVREVRNHFGCEELQGAELEGEGPVSAIGNHWDLRVFGNELMAPVILSSNQPLSRITLALLEDTGWYKANYEMAEDFLGNNLGCDFANKSCLGYYNADSVKEENAFCFEENEQGCTATRNNIGTCWILNYQNELSPIFQYFDDPNKGGPFLFAEYCPFYMSSHDCTNANQQSLSPLFTNGPNSRCFNHMGNLSISTGSTSLTQPLLAGCYQYSCDNTGVRVSIGASVYHCTERGQVLSVQEQVGVITYRLSLICPACETICWDRLELCRGEGTPIPPTESSPPTSDTGNTGNVVGTSVILTVLTLLIAVLI